MSIEESQPTVAAIQGCEGEMSKSMMKKLAKKAEKEKKKAEHQAKAGAPSAPPVVQQVGAQISYDPPSGTRDCFPEDMRLRNWLFSKWKETGACFGFQEYDAPVLENEELYKRKAGEEITEQMYNFIDKEGNKVTLRPEMTPTLARMVLSTVRRAAGEAGMTTGRAMQAQSSELFPLKWFSVPQCWRFETTQRGRKREHYQWNMDIVGVKDVTAELELLSAMVNFFKSVGITSDDVGIKVNSRAVLGTVLEKAGVQKENFAKVCIVVDKLDKVGREEVVRQMVADLGIDEVTANRVVDATSAKDVQALKETAGSDCGAGIADLEKLFVLAESYGIADWLIFDATVVRGLAYYTGIVWEAFDKKGVLRAIAGGGRYDGLMSLYGSPTPIPCVGYGFGDCVIYELLKEKKLLPPLPLELDFVVAAYKGMMGPALQVAAGLRQGGFKVDVMLEEGKKVDKQFKYADKVGARMIAFVAPAEFESGKVSIKDLRAGNLDSRKQVNVPLEELSQREKIEAYFRS